MDSPVNQNAILDLDIKEIKKFYSIIKSKKPLYDLLIKAKSTLLKTMAKPTNKYTSEKNIRPLLIALEFPDHIDLDYYPSILSPLLTAINSVPNTYKNLFVDWFESYTKQQMAELVRAFQQFLTITCLDLAYDRLLAPHITSAVKVFKLISKV